MCLTPHPYSENHHISFPKMKIHHALSQSLQGDGEGPGSLAGKSGGYPEAGSCQPNSQAPINPHPSSSSFFPLGPQKLLGKLCEQNKVVREQERLVQQLRAEKVSSGWGVLWVGLAWVWRCAMLSVSVLTKLVGLCLPQTSCLPGTVIL